MWSVIIHDYLWWGEVSVLAFVDLRSLSVQTLSVLMPTMYVIESSVGRPLSGLAHTNITHISDSEICSTISLEWHRGPFKSDTLYWSIQGLKRIYADIIPRRSQNLCQSLLLYLVYRLPTLRVCHQRNGRDKTREHCLFYGRGMGSCIGIRQQPVSSDPLCAR